MLVKFEQVGDSDIYIKASLVQEVKLMWHTEDGVEFPIAGQSWISLGEEDDDGYEVIGTLDEVAAKLNGEGK